MLWFDVEVRYNTTYPRFQKYCTELWFDVEVRYNTTAFLVGLEAQSCGLM